MMNEQEDWEDFVDVHLPKPKLDNLDEYDC